jgi:hypothetical protein
MRLARGTEGKIDISIGDIHRAVNDDLRWPLSNPAVVHRPYSVLHGAREIRFGKSTRAGRG